MPLLSSRAVLILGIVLMSAALPALAQGSDPAVEAGAAPPGTAPATQAPPPASQSAQPGSETSTIAPTAAATRESSMPAPPPVAIDPEAPPVSPGPLEDQRRKLLETIITAKGYGFGIAAYLNAFKYLDDRVKAGAPESEIKRQLDSIVQGLSEQLKRSRELKAQKPAPPIAESSPPPSAMIPSGVKNAIAGGKIDGNLIEAVKDKWFGGEIPDSIKRKIPAGIDPNSINPEMAKELLRRYGGR